jgi:hypothetical protein
LTLWPLHQFYNSDYVTFFKLKYINDICFFYGWFVENIGCWAKFKSKVV